MCKRNSPNTNEASTGRVRENPLIKKKQKKQTSTGCARETHLIKKKKKLMHKNECSTGCVKEIPH